MAEIVVLGAGLGGTCPGNIFRTPKRHTDESEPFYERFVLNRLDIQKLKQPEMDPVSHA